MSATTTPFESQARLWLMAFIASALVNVAVFVVIVFTVIARIVVPSASPAEPDYEPVAVIVPHAAEEPVAVPATPDPALQPVRTSPDQEAPPPERADFMGERDTRATSDATPAAEAPELPAQRGREPLFDDEVETTESRYQDGELDSDPVPQAPAEPVPPTPAETAAAMPEAPEPARRDGVEEPVPTEEEDARERFADGPAPVERRVKEAPEEDAPKPAPQARTTDGREPAEEPAKEQPKAANATKPAFQGNQSKTRLVGSITRRGRSALNVEDSVLGRYHAAVSRAVEKEWQLNCIRNRDYITPGMLTMSFDLDAAGKVRGIRVVEALQVGAIPKGFTLNAINDAKIPAMPADLKKQLDGEPLELIYRFSF